MSTTTRGFLRGDLVTADGIDFEVLVNPDAGRRALVMVLNVATRQQSRVATSKLAMRTAGTAHRREVHARLIEPCACKVAGDHDGLNRPVTL